MKLQAIKHKCIEDNDGEVTLILKVSLQDKSEAYNIPVKRLLKLNVEVEDE